MTNSLKAIIFAAAMLLNAFLKARGILSESSANTMFAVLPMLAVLSLRGDLKCKLFDKKEA